MNQRKILIADDSELDRALLVDMLEHDFSILEVSDGKEAVAALQAHRGEIEVLLLDVVMPQMDGFEVLAYMNETGFIKEVPVIMISAEKGSAYIDKAFKLGAADYVGRPFVPSVVRRRIINTTLLHTKKQQLMSIVTERFYQKEKNNELLVAILGHAVESHGAEDGTHMAHVGLATGLLLQRLAEKTDRYHLEQADVEAIRMASELHDIGKLQIPSEILTKPGPLTAEEYEIVKRHTMLGAKIITELPIYQNERLVKYAIEICHWHHERWNGDGYPDGLRGDEIPIAAQVVSLADAYDALTSKRCYKEAYSNEKAMSMLDAGDCGSFNPLLLECLHEIEHRLVQELKVDFIADPHQSAARRVVEELYNGTGDSDTRVAAQLEEEHSKRKFFSELTEEIWFEYTAQPSALALSAGAVRLTGLPRLMVDPLDCAELKTVISPDLIASVRERIQGMTADETYFETEAEIVLEGKKRWCQLAVMLVWSVSEPGRCSSLMGQVRSIDFNYRRLTELSERLAHERPAQKMTPVMAEDDGVLRITRTQVDGVLRGYRQMFDVARLVDPSICMELREGDGAIGKKEHCYAVWNKPFRCERCISQEIVRTKKSLAKIETRGNDVFYMVASYIEVDGLPYSLELANHLHGDDILDEGAQESVLSQLLMRNRQVYMDSVTKVYNRRYYDERLKNLNGEFAFAMIDMDNFKTINDRFGHLAGDAALYRAAQAIKSQIRDDDKLVRYGGDEFFLLFRDLPRHILEKKLQAIRVAMDSIDIPEFPQLHISASIGGAFVKGRISQTIRKADLVMYKAKAKKDCVAIYREKNDDEAE